MDDLQHAELLNNTAVYFSTVAALALWELLAPRATLTAPLGRRWLSNAALALIDTGVIRLAFPAIGVAFAVMLADGGLGLFNRVAVPAWIAAVVTIVAADLARYWTHRLMHAVPLLWRLHGTHHTDHDFDFTTALRFHPFESVLTTAVALAVFTALGAPPVAMLAVEPAFMISTLVNHGNIRLPAGLERAVRLVFVTPGVHRIHHSADRTEAGSNYATLFSFWDRLFGTYTPRPAAGERAMAFGVAGFAAPKHLDIGWMLLFPFLRTPAPPPPRADLQPAGGRHLADT